MRHLQLRVTVWRLMVTIALIAVVMGVAVSPRWRTCSQEANYHASEEQAHLQAAGPALTDGIGYRVRFGTLSAGGTLGRATTRCSLPPSERAGNNFPICRRTHRAEITS
jgi:hypothetical protein